MKMQHITIQTRQLEESIRFYEQVAGLAIQQDMRNGSPSIVFLANGAAETCVELVENAEAPYTGSGISIGFHTDDVEQKRAELMQQGYEVTPVISPNPHVKFFFTRDPNGVQIQFI